MICGGVNLIHLVWDCIPPPPSASPLPCIYPYIKLYISCLCIPNVIIYLWAVPQIMFVNIWVSISGFNKEHHVQSRVILTAVVEGKSRICWGSQESLHFLAVFIFELSSFLWLTLVLGSPSFMGSSCLRSS